MIRDKYIQEMHDRAQQEQLKEQNFKNNNNDENKPKFTNSKGGNKNAFLRGEGNDNFDRSSNTNNQFTNSNENNEGARKFTNSKRPKQNIQPVLDPNVPTLTADKDALEVKVSLQTWD